MLAINLLFSRYVTRLHDAPSPGRWIHKSHWWYRGDVTCNGVTSLRYTKREVTRGLERDTFRLCPKCFPQKQS